MLFRSRSYIFQYARASHDFQFTTHSAGAQNWQLNSFNRFSTFQWVINGVQSPQFWLSDFMDTKFGTFWNDNATTAANQLQLQPAYQTWYELKDPINLAAGVNASFVFTPQSGLTTIAAYVVASTPYAPNTGVVTSSAANTLTLELNGFQWSVIS